MACSINLYDTLQNPKQPNGTWSQSTGCDGNPINNPGTVTITGGYLGTVDFTGKPVGTYRFAYSLTIPGCGTSCVETTIIVHPRAEAGVNGTITVCNNLNQNIILADLLDGVFNGIIPPGISNDGVWNVGTLPNYNQAGSGPLDDFFNPFNAPVGTYVITYTVDHSGPGTPPNCTNCQDISTITINIVAAPQFGGNGSATVCN